VDRFRRFIFESKFLEIFDISDERLEKIRNDELEVMKLGFDYTKYILGIEETLKKK
jgi:hypothetical protein